MILSFSLSKSFILGKKLTVLWRGLSNIDKDWFWGGEKLNEDKVEA